MTDEYGLARMRSRQNPYLTLRTPVLYLDYDGVLHPEDVYRHPRRGIYLDPKYSGHVLFEHCNLLAAELAPYPQMSIVLSTSWVRVLRYTRALGYLPLSLRERVIGATFHTRMERHLFSNLSRGQQVVADVGRRRPSAWLALDDNDEHWPAAHRRHLVHTDPVEGLAAVVDELRDKLRAIAL